MAPALIMGESSGGSEVTQVRLLLPPVPQRTAELFNFLQGRPVVLVIFQETQLRPKCKI